MASVPISVLLHNGPLLYGFNVPIKGSTDKLTWYWGCGWSVHVEAQSVCYSYCCFYKDWRVGGQTAPPDKPLGHNPPFAGIGLNQAGK